MKLPHFSSEVRGAASWTDRPWHRLLWSLAVPWWDAEKSGTWQVRLVVDRLPAEKDGATRDRILGLMSEAMGAWIPSASAYSPGMPLMFLSRFGGHSYEIGEVHQVGEVQGGSRALEKTGKIPCIRLGDALLGSGPDGQHVRLATEEEFHSWLEAMSEHEACTRVRRLAIALAKLGWTWDYDPLEEPPLAGVAVPESLRQQAVDNGDDEPDETADGDEVASEEAVPAPDGEVIF